MDAMVVSSNEYCYQGKEITRFTVCPSFVQRTVSIGGDHLCWFCQYAEYDLSTEKLPEKGMCRYPKKQRK